MFLTTAAICLAANIYHESRGEPIVGQVAIALVTMNRAGGEPHRVCDVVLKRKQFSWTAGLVRANGQMKQRGIPKEPLAWTTAELVASIVLNGWVPDITRGATHYHEQSIRPWWSRSMPLVATYGAHKFYREYKVIAD